MNIAIDIDDTLVSTFEYFMPFVAEYLDVPLAYLEENEISYDNTPKEWNMDMIDFAHHYFDEYVPSTPPKTDAKEVLKAMRRAGHRIFIITHRNNELYRDCYATTEKELENCGFVYDRLICTYDKGKASKDNSIELLIDDTISNLDEVSALGINVLLFTSTANKEIETSYSRVSCWRDIALYLDLEI